MHVVVVLSVFAGSVAHAFYNPEMPETSDQPPAPADQRPDLGASGGSSAASFSSRMSTYLSLNVSGNRRYRMIKARSHAVHWLQPVKEIA